MTSHQINPATLFALFAFAACSSTPTPDATKDAMADMPGMAMSEGAGAVDSVTLTAAQIQHGKVEWGEATASATTSGAPIPGSITPNEDRLAVIGSPVRGRVLSVLANPGARVAEGQVLVWIESLDASMANSDVAKAMAGVGSQRALADFATSARARADRLLALGAIPRQEYERTIAEDDAARAALRVAESELVRAREAGRNLGVDTLATGKIAIRSPLAGVVLSRQSTPGNIVDMGAPLVSVGDLSTLWVTANVPEGLAAPFVHGATIQFTVPAYPADTMRAKLDAVGPGLDPMSRSLPIRATVTNPGGKLRPQMLATIMLSTSSSSAISLPDDAVQIMQGKTVVFIAMPDTNGTAHFMARTVVVGERSGGRITIVSGVAAGDLVVMHGAFAIRSQLQKGSMPDMEM